MEDLLFDILTILFCVTGYYFSWRFFTSSKYHISVLLLVASGLLLRVYISSDFFLHNWDERYHALVAKNLIHHPLIPTLYDNPILPYDFNNWTANHIWLHKQPLPLWTMASSMWLFGVNEIALRLPSILLTSLGIYLTFSIGTFFFNNKVGYLAALFYSINGLIIELTGGIVSTDHIDIFFLFFIELAIFFSIKFVQKEKTIYNILVGVSIGAAILTKWLPALIVLPIWLLLAFNSKKFTIPTILVQFFILLSVCIIIFIPWQLYIWQEFPIEAEIESNYNFSRITRAVEGRSGSVFFHLDWIRINYHDLIYLPILWFLIRLYKNPKCLKSLALFIWIFIPLVFFSIAKTKMQAYLLFTAPALFIIVGAFYQWIIKLKTNQRFIWALNILLILIIALPARFSIERLKPFSKKDRNPQWVVDLKEFNKRGIEKGVLFNYPNPIEAMFYTDLTAYSVLPKKEVIHDLIIKGYTVFIFETEDIPKDILEINDIKIESLSANNIDSDVARGIDR